jgi:hypothetical protein
MNLVDEIARIRARFLAEAPGFYTGSAPETLLGRLSCNFGMGDGLDQEPFITRVRDEHAAFVAEYEDAGPVWSPEEVVLNFARVLVLYTVRLPQTDETRFGMAELRAADGRQFTAGELLWAVYQATAVDVRAGPHREFEGLELVYAFDAVVAGLPVWVPVYRMHLGS